MLLLLLVMLVLVVVMIQFLVACNIVLLLHSRQTRCVRGLLQVIIRVTCCCFCCVRDF